VTPGPTEGDLGVASLVVGLADEYDLLTEVGTPDGEVVGREEALERLRGTPASREDVVRALEHALALRLELSPS
jgi:hypothetical protein